MSTIIHKAVIVTTRDWSRAQYNNDVGPKVVMPDIDAFRTEMPQELHHLLVGPVRGINGFITYFWAPSGSKIGWAFDQFADEWCERFIALWGDSALWGNIEPPGDCPHDVLVIKYGEDNTTEGIAAHVREPYAWYAKEHQGRATRRERADMAEEGLEAAVEAVQGYMGPDVPRDQIEVALVGLKGLMTPGEDDDDDR